MLVLQRRRSSLASFDIGLRFRSLKFFWTALSERQGGLEFSWAAKPETDTFGHEPALAARTCSPANLLGFLKFVGTPRVVRLFDATPLRPARPDCAKDMDDSAERHYTASYLHRPSAKKRLAPSFRVLEPLSWPSA